MSRDAIALAMTGASGAAYGLRLLECLLEAQKTVYLMLSPAAQKVYAAPRLGRLRISPHVYNDEEDVDRFVAAFKTAAA